MSIEQMHKMLHIYTTGPCLAAERKCLTETCYNVAETWTQYYMKNIPCMVYLYA